MKDATVYYVEKNSKNLKTINNEISNEKKEKHPLDICKLKFKQIHVLRDACSRSRVQFPAWYSKSRALPAALCAAAVWQGKNPGVKWRQNFMFAETRSCDQSNTIVPKVSCLMSVNRFNKIIILNQRTASGRSAVARAKRGSWSVVPSASWCTDRHAGPPAPRSVRPTKSVQSDNLKQK